MAQINLLSPSSSKPNIGQAVLSIGLKILVGILALLILFYAFILISSGRTKSSIRDLRSKISTAEGAVMGQKDRQELITRQGQIQALNGILKNHVYWSQLFPKLAESTLKTAAYVSFSASDVGTGTMIVSVPSYTDLDKFLQVFDLPQFNQNFSDVRISSITRSQKGDALETKAEIQFKYNGSLIKKSQ